jgi:RNA polymerase sigma-70 factor (ECF subfamily)
MMAGAPDSDQEILQGIRSGNEEAFLGLYRRRQGALYRFALHMSGSAPVAEDITQEVFMVLLRDECGFDPSRGTLSGYLFGVARKLLLRHLDRERADLSLEPEGENAASIEPAITDSPLDDLTHRERIEELRRAVAALPRRYREVVVLCDLEEVDYADAAVALGCPIGTVRSRLHRARALLLDKMQRERPTAGPVKELKPARVFL